MTIKPVVALVGACAMATAVVAQDASGGPERTAETDDTPPGVTSEASTPYQSEIEVSGDKPEVKVTAGVKNPEEVTCKSTIVVGSRIKQRVCMTNFEWWDRQTTQKENMRTIVNRNSSCGAGRC